MTAPQARTLADLSERERGAVGYAVGVLVGRYLHERDAGTGHTSPWFETEAFLTWVNARPEWSGIWAELRDTVTTTDRELFELAGCTEFREDDPR